jgi:hypothetical protein
LWSRVAVIGALGVGTLVLVIIAGVIRNHGLGNGYAALIASTFVIRILRGHMLSKDHLIALACMLAIAIAFIAVARWRIARPQQPPLRIPTSGIAPLSDVGGLALLIGVLSQLHLDRLGSIKLEQWVATAHDDLWIGLALVVLWTLAWSFLFARPRVFPAPRPSWQTWWDATAVTLVLLGFVGGAALVTIHARPTLSLLLDVTRTGVLAMFLLDCYDDFRVRRRNLDRVWTVHQAQHADLVEIKLADAGIPCHLASSHLRTMLAFFGPWAPIDVLVPTEHAPAARTLLSESVPL